MPFRIQFFTIRLTFLIFDSFVFLFILIIGLYLEYNEYSMD
ncbi:hypothetical protein ALC60_06940 [Trachymyrmex zeteki]|uniref:Uncharacterized protein n=1 Tax=Mycetomoellerius zeteki TaxID=64791 RepID=A0A151X178_9HYME|nr:hypothetical protein ALC60_06940 [Trachymyrmex zeteki]